MARKVRPPKKLIQPKTLKQRCRDFMAAEGLEQLFDEARHGKGIAKTTAAALVAKLGEVERQDLALTEYHVVTIPFDEVVQKYGDKIKRIESA